MQSQCGDTLNSQDENFKLNDLDIWNVCSVAGPYSLGDEHIGLSVTCDRA